MRRLQAVVGQSSLNHTAAVMQEGGLPRSLPHAVQVLIAAGSGLKPHQSQLT
jgi:hypothetical protein